MRRPLARRPPGRRLSIRHALALGLIQGPAELLPISSSGHVVLVPALLGWPYDRLHPAHRKAFEVALHVGTAAGLAIALRREAAAAARSLDRRRAGELGLSAAPATCAGLFLHRLVEERLSAPRQVAAAQVVAGTALWAADLGSTERHARSAETGDALAVGLAQAAALAPGVSRGGAALCALRLRRFERRSASVLARRAAAPIVLGAAALELRRLRGLGLPAELRLPFAAGTAAALASTLASAPLAHAMDGMRSYTPIAAYRVGLGAFALLRLGRTASRRGRPLEWHA